MSFDSDLLVPARLFNAKLSHFSHFHETQEICAFVVFFQPNLEKAQVSNGARFNFDWLTIFQADSPIGKLD